MKKYGPDCLEFKSEYLEVIYDRKKQEEIILTMLDLYEQSNEEPQEKLVTLMEWLSLVFPLLKETSFR